MKKIVLILVCLLFAGGCLELAQTPTKDNPWILDADLAIEESLGKDVYKKRI